MLINYQPPTLHKVVTAGSGGFVTLAEAKEQLSYHEEETQHDNYIENSLIPAATAAIENYLRRPVRTSSHEYYFEPPSKFLLIPTGPVAVTAVAVDGATLSSSDYESWGDDDRLYIRLDDVSFDSSKMFSIKVSVSAGWAAIPEAIKQAAMIMIADMHDFRGSDAMRVAEASMSARFLLEPYRL